MPPAQPAQPRSGKRIPSRLTGPLSAATGVLLAAVTLLHAAYLWNLPSRVRGEYARAELRGLSQALRCRLERDLKLLDHNAPAMERALQELVAGSTSLRWAALYEAEGRRLAEAGPAARLRPDQLAAARRERLPQIHRLSAGEILGLTRLWVAEREMVLAAGFSPEGETAADRLGPIIAGALAAGLAASFLLVARGLIETAAARRRA